MCSVEKRGNIFILTLTSKEENDDHRLNPSLISSIRCAIADIKSQSVSSPESSFALITTATGKFFSNGFDLRWAKFQSTGDSDSNSKSSYLNNIHHMVDCFKPLVSDLLSLPMPTIAAINGHAAAAGFALALSHDYVFMRKDRGVLYMSEVDMGLPFPEYFNVLFKEKLSWKARREIMMRGRKLRGEQGLELGVVDQVFGTADLVFEAAFNLGQELVNKKWNGNIYAEIRKGLCPHLCQELDLTRNTIMLPRI
ncbi:Enoyl-CoA delta isomerase 3 [Bienertia sinuspersici]